nr:MULTISPECIES: DUF6783 domain-containing protein [Blautia]
MIVCREIDSPALIRAKSPTNCDAHLAESLFQTRSSTPFLLHFRNK